MFEFSAAAVPRLRKQGPKLSHFNYLSWVLTRQHCEASSRCGLCCWHKLDLERRQRRSVHGFSKIGCLPSEYVSSIWIVYLLSILPTLKTLCMASVAVEHTSWLPSWLSSIRATTLATAIDTVDNLVPFNMKLMTLFSTDSLARVLIPVFVNVYKNQFCSLVEQIYKPSFSFPQF